MSLPLIVGGIYPLLVLPVVQSGVRSVLAVLGGA